MKKIKIFSKLILKSLGIIRGGGRRGWEEKKRYKNKDKQNEPFFQRFLSAR